MTRLILRNVFCTRRLSRHHAGAWLAPVLLLGAIATSVACAQEQKLPKGEALIEKYIEVTGGKDAYKKIKNRVTKGSLEMPAQGIKIVLTTYAARPDEFRAVMESDAIGRIERGVCDGVVWELSTMTGPQVYDGDMKVVMLRGARFDAAENWRAIWKKAECVGVETVDGKRCYKVAMTPNEGPAETRYYDAESNLLVKTDLTLNLPSGKIAIESYPGDYKKFDGILYACKTRQVMMGMEQVVTTETIEHNVAIPEDRFKLPDDVKELMEIDAAGDSKAKGAGSETP